jgi:hypothetical protein
MKNFTLYWKDGKRQVIEANDDESFTQAFSRVLPEASIGSLYFHSEGNTDKYEFNREFKRWDKKKFQRFKQESSPVIDKGNCQSCGGPKGECIY